MLTTALEATAQRIAIGAGVLLVCFWLVSLLQPPRADILIGLAAFGELWRALLTTASWCTRSGSGLSSLQILELCLFGLCAGISTHPVVRPASRATPDRALRATLQA